MPFDFKESTIFVSERTGRHSIEDSVEFPSAVRHAAIFIKEFSLHFPHDDKHINLMEVNTDFVSASGSTVTFRVECLLADKNFDDPYFGRIEILVVADLY